MHVDRISQKQHRVHALYSTDNSVYALRVLCTIHSKKKLVDLTEFWLL